MYFVDIYILFVLQCYTIGFIGWVLIILSGVLREIVCFTGEIMFLLILRVIFFDFIDEWRTIFSNFLIPSGNFIHSSNIGTDIILIIMIFYTFLLFKILHILILQFIIFDTLSSNISNILKNRFILRKYSFHHS